MKLSVLAFTGGVALASAAAWGHSGATGVVKQRMDAMKDMAAAMKMTGAMARGNAPFDATRAASASQRIEDHARQAPELFPQGSFGHPSEARPLIAAKRDDFAGHAARLGAAAARMREAAQLGDVNALAAARAEAGRACSGCHKVYREKTR